MPIYYNVDTPQKIYSFTDYEKKERILTIDRIFEGMFIGISVMNYFHDSDDYGGVRKGFSVPAVLRVISIKKSTAPLFFADQRHEVAVETPDKGRFMLYCTVHKGKDQFVISRDPKFISHQWEMDPGLKEWIQIYMKTKIVRRDFNITTYMTMAEVQTAQQQMENARKA